MPRKKIVRLKIFLCDFPDVRAPRGYTKDFIRELIFAASTEGKSPAPNSVNFGATAYQYFFAHSDGWLRLHGDVTEWAHSSIKSADIPHYKSTMQKPSASSGKVDYGGSWPVIVAETLRNLGFVSTRHRSGARLRDAILALPGGQKADKVVFLNADIASGGVKRTFGQMKTQLNVMSHAKVRYNQIPGTDKKWNTLWDDSWSGLPGLLATPILTAGRNNKRANGTLPGPSPATSELNLSALSIIFHELGHLATGFPDLYGMKYGPWGVYDLMGGPQARTHYPMPFASWCRNQAGWLAFRERSREDHDLRIHPFESHNEAYRLTNGAPGSNHFLVLENRDHLDYPGLDKKPVSKGRMLLAYRLDPHGRLRVKNGDTKHARKITSLIRKSASPGAAWKPGKTIGAVPSKFHSSPETCRNARGELWWQVDGIEKLHAGDLRIKTRMQALHLLGDYHRALWAGKAPGKRAVKLEQDFFGGKNGHVILQEHTLKVKGKSRGRALYLHPRWETNGSIHGFYPLLNNLKNTPLRLYAKVAMSDEATGSNGATLHFKAGSQDFSVNLMPGDYKEICIDFNKPAHAFEVIVEAKGSATRDWVYILDGWLVPIPTVAYDFLANANKASWVTGAGALSFGVMDQPTGEASLRSSMTMHDGQLHWPNVLFTHPDWNADGFIEATWSNVQVPAKGGFVRAAIGWHKGRRVTDNGATITATVKVGDTETVLINKAKLDLYKQSTNPAKRNDLMLLEMPLPASARDKKVRFRFRVETDGSAAQDWVSWRYLSLTEA